jgi:hypothetical protein
MVKMLDGCVVLLVYHCELYISNWRRWSKLMGVTLSEKLDFSAAFWAFSDCSERSRFSNERRMSGLLLRAISRALSSVSICWAFAVSKSWQNTKSIKSLPQPPVKPGQALQGRGDKKRGSLILFLNMIKNYKLFFKFSVSQNLNQGAFKALRQLAEGGLGEAFLTASPI